MALGTNPRIPSDVYTADAAGVGERRLTTLNDSLLSQVYVSDYHEIRYPSFDGRQAHAWYLLPLGHRPGRGAPLAVQIHGGPHAMWGPGEASMWLEYQMLAGAGYTVFLSNPRGSSGYGTPGLRAIQRDWGTSPARDILIGADSVIARGVADPDRQVVAGGSYAGYMTAWLIAREAPARFKAAVAARGVYDLGIWYYGSNTWRLFEGEFGTRPWEDPEIVRAQSPLTYVASIQTPLLLLHADTDFRATIASAEALYRAMKVLGKEVEFVRYPREGHELTRGGEPAHRIDHMLRTLGVLRALHHALSADGPRPARTLAIFGGRPSRAGRPSASFGAPAQAAAGRRVAQTAKIGTESALAGPDGGSREGPIRFTVTCEGTP